MHGAVIITRVDVELLGRVCDVLCASICSVASTCSAKKRRRGGGRGPTWYGPLPHRRGGLRKDNVPLFMNAHLPKLDNYTHSHVLLM